MFGPGKLLHLGILIIKKLRCLRHRCFGMYQRFAGGHYRGEPIQVLLHAVQLTLARTVSFVEPLAVKQ